MRKGKVGERQSETEKIQDCVGEREREELSKEGLVQEGIYLLNVNGKTLHTQFGDDVVVVVDIVVF